MARYRMVSCGSLLRGEAGAGKPELTAAGRLAYKTATTVLASRENLFMRRLKGRKAAC
jgi:hypothetical protein